MLARDVMSGDVVTIGLNGTLLEAVKLLINARVSALPVIDESGALAGILSEFDVIRHVAGGDAAASFTFGGAADGPGTVAASKALATTVKGIMTTPVLTAPDDAELTFVAEFMLKHRLKRIPIVRGGSVVGIVSRVDLLKAMISASGDAAVGRADASPRKPVPDSEDQLREKVIAAVRQENVGVSGGLDVVIRHRAAHLWGEVTNEAAHQACCAAAARVPGVTDVVSHMHVVPLRNRGLFVRRG